MVTRGPAPVQGEIWWADLDPIVGHEQAGRRPVLIISSNEFQRIQRRLVIVVPFSRRLRNNPFHVRVPPSESGLPYLSSILCDQIRTISTARLDATRIGRVSRAVLTHVVDLVRMEINPS